MTKCTYSVKFECIFMSPGNRIYVICLLISVHNKHSLQTRNVSEKVQKQRNKKCFRNKCCMCTQTGNIQDNVSFFVGPFCGKSVVCSLSLSESISVALCSMTKLCHRTSLASYSLLISNNSNVLKVCVQCPALSL